MTIYGYARVSSRDQKLDRQINAFREFGILEENIYLDKASDKDFDRPQYQNLLTIMQPGDMLIIKSVDRLGRNYDAIISEWRKIVNEMNVNIKVLDIPLLDTSMNSENGLLGRLISDLFLQFMSYQAEQEKESIKSRQREGIKSAQERGVKFGRPKLEDPKNLEDLYDKYISGQMRMSDIAKKCGYCQNTVRSRFKNIEQKRKKK